jgi:hypothetical protein
MIRSQPTIIDVEASPTFDDTDSYNILLAVANNYTQELALYAALEARSDATWLSWYTAIGTSLESA